MGAAVIVCSLEAARAAGVPDDQLVFPHARRVRRRSSGSSRARRSSPRPSRCAPAPDRAVRRAVRRRPTSSATSTCTAASRRAVQMGADALGIDVLADDRPPTVTGGMTFFGGPGNNYVTPLARHDGRRACARAPARRASSPGSAGTPRRTRGAPTRRRRPHGAFARRGRPGRRRRGRPCATSTTATRATAVVESYTVGHDRGGGPTRVDRVAAHPEGRAVHRRERRPDASPRRSRRPTRSTSAVEVRDGAISLR